MAAAVAVLEVEQDPSAVRAAKILVSLRFRELRERPEWALAPATASREASEPAAAPIEVPERWGRRRPRSCRSWPGSCLPWLKALRELHLAGSGVDAAPSCGAAAGSGSPSTSSADRAKPRPDGKTAAAAAKEPMKAASPDTPLDYGAGGSGASSSADDALRPPAKRSPPGARGSGGAASSADDDEGCSSPLKRPRVAAVEEKPIPMEQSMQSETSASSSKGFAFDLNFPPPDDAACPDAF